MCIPSTISRNIYHNADIDNYVVLGFSPYDGQYRVESFQLNGHANASESHPDHGYYNSKIDYLEIALQNLETSVQQKETHMDTLLRQVLLTLNKIDAKTSGLQKMSFEIQHLKALTKNGNSMFYLI